MTGKLTQFLLLEILVIFSTVTGRWTCPNPKILANSCGNSGHKGTELLYLLNRILCSVQHCNGLVAFPKGNYIRFPPLLLISILDESLFCGV